MAGVTPPLGIVLNNPGCIRFDANNNWRGRLPPERWSPQQRQYATQYEIFASPEEGLRAMGKLLVDAYYDRHGLRTIEQIIARYAPPGRDGNNTENYINAVSMWTQTARNVPINLHDRDTLKRLMQAMVRFETGGWPVPDATFERALVMLGYPPEAKPAFARASYQSATGVAAGSVLAALEPMRTLNEWMPYIILAVTLAFVLWGIFGESRERAGMPEV